VSESIHTNTFLACSAYDIIRNQYLSVRKLQKLFEKTHSQHILKLIKDTGIYKNILLIIIHRFLNMYTIIY